MKTLSSDFFKNNRRHLGASISGGLLVVTAYDAMQAVSDMAQPFRQEPNFYYLTGLTSARWKMIYDASRDYCWLVRPHMSQIEKTFDGALSDEDAIERSGANTVIDESEFETVLRQQAKHHSAVYTVEQLKVADYSFWLNPALGKLQAQLDRCFSGVVDVRKTLARQRALKQPEELQMIRQAVKITAEAFRIAKQQIGEVRSEYQLEAIFTGHFRSSNAVHAYDPIVASGARANVLHYTANNQSFGRNQLVLCDIGAEYEGYASDVTRILAIRPPTKRQAEVYQALLTAQRAIIAGITPHMPVTEYQSMVDGHMHQAFKSLKLMGDEWDEKRCRRYMPHAVSHGMGIDVHDSLGETRTLEPQMVLTVEPGIYIAEEGIGMRIEDDIVITDKGPENLTAMISTNLE